MQFRHVQSIPGLSGMHELRQRWMSWWPLSQQLRWHERGKLLGMYTMCGGTVPKRLRRHIYRSLSRLRIWQVQDLVRLGRVLKLWRMPSGRVPKRVRGIVGGLVRSDCRLDFHDSVYQWG